MKILTIANPRSGSTYFGEYWASKYKIPYIHEPVFMDDLLSGLDGNNSFSMKIVISQLYYYYHMECNLSFEDSINAFYKLISKYEFDNIIILDRRDKITHTESIINLFTGEPGKGFSQWAYNEDFKKSITSDTWAKWNSYVTEATKWLTATSEKFNIPIVYYEDVYYNPTSVDLNGLEFKPDLNRKQRQDSSTTLM